MNKSQIKLAAILFGIFFPVLASTLFFMVTSDTGFGGKTNKGQLINPVIDITAFKLINAEGNPEYLPFEEQVQGVDPDDYVARPWGVIYLGSGVCDASCMERLVYLRQIQVRLGTEASRIQRYYLDTDDALTETARTLMNEQFPGMKILRTSANIWRVLQGNGVVPDSEARHLICVVDPVGNVMLYFTPDNTPEDILSDLDTLLDQSSLG